MNNYIKLICENMMTEQIPAPSAAIGGGVESQSTMNTMLPGDIDPSGMSLDMGCEIGDEGDTQFKPEHIQAAKDLITMVGSADKARELIDKVDEALEVFDDGGEDEQAIDLVASLIPEIPDMPMQKSITSISSRFDPSANI